MSTYYFIYTEINCNNKWFCINNKIKKIDKNEFKLSYTYWSGSRSYFSETYEKLETIGKPIEKQKLSEELKEIYGTKQEQYEELPIVVDFKNIKECIPAERINEYHGYVDKNHISNYKLNDEEIYDWIDIEEYRKLNFKEKLMYDYFEWDGDYGWFKYFKEIIEHVKWQIFEWEKINFLKEIEQIRLVCFRF